MSEISSESKKIKVENIIWAVNRDYSIDLDVGLLGETEIPALTHFRAIIFAYLYKSKDYRGLIQYLNKKKQATQKVEIYSEIMMLTLEEVFMDKLKAESLGVASIEKNTVDEVVLYYDKLRKRRDVYHEIRYAYYTDKKQKVPKTNPRVVDLMHEIQDFKNMEILHDFKRYTRKLDDLLEKHFHFEKTEDEGLDQKSKGQEEKADRNQDKKRSGKDQRKNESGEVPPLEIASAEFSQYDIGRTKEKLEKDQAEAPKNIELSFDENIYHKIVEIYGQAKIRGRALENLEKELSVGIHANSKIHITDRFLEVKGYKRAVLESAMEANMEQYDYSSRVYRRNIIKLRDNLVRTITEDMDYAHTKLDNGLLDAEKIWRKAILGDDNIFFKDFRDERGEIIVDILLDASGSQRQRQNLVAIQAFIIAQALSMANIPCRVSSFNNLFDYTIIKQYRDFKDSEAKNKTIFSYLAEGSNRDGLAIATMGKMLLERNEDHKVLIVLSDGKPNDERVTGAGSLSTSGTKAYTGDAAIEDTAQNIRVLRAKGIAVLGVFTGNHEDLAAEQKIFGRDFAYISNIERFSEIVGVYLKKQIVNMLDQQ